MSNEKKIGILTVVAVTLLISGYKFIMGQNIFTTSTLLNVDYEQVDQLAASSPVFINGFKVGMVSKVFLKEDMSTIRVVLNIDKGISIHKNAVAEIANVSVMGGKSIRIVENSPCSGADCAQNEDFIKGRLVGLLNSMVPQDEMQQYFTFVKENMGDIFDTLNSKIQNPDPNNNIGEILRNLQGTLANLKSTTDQLNGMLAASSGKINRTLSNVEGITSTIKGNSDKINTMMDNAAAFSGQLKDLDLKSTMSKADSTMANANVAVEQLTATLKTADLAMNDVQSLLAKVKNGEGNVGLLFNDEKLYHNLNRMSMQVDSFLTDFKEKPYRYIPLKSRNKIRRYDRKDAKEEAEGK